MLKTGFRGERKRILTPSLSQGEGECSDGKGVCSDGKGECSDGKGECSGGDYTACGFTF